MAQSCYEVIAGLLQLVCVQRYALGWVSFLFCTAMLRMCCVRVWGSYNRWTEDLEPHIFSKDCLREFKGSWRYLQQRKNLISMHNLCANSLQVEISGWNFVRLTGPYNCRTLKDFRLCVNVHLPFFRRLIP